MPSCVLPIPQVRLGKVITTTKIKEMKNHEAHFHFMYISQKSKENELFDAKPRIFEHFSFSLELHDTSPPTK